MKQKKGILITVTGHPYYGRLAYNLALSLKSVEAGISITLLHRGAAINHLSENQLKVFDELLTLSPQAESGCRSKLWAYGASPYKHTLTLDADMLWLPKNKPSDLLNSLEGVPFTAITEGDEHFPNLAYYFWADVGEIREAWDPKGTIYQFRSEVMYFERSDKANKLFKLAQKVAKDPKVSVQKYYAQEVPDELAINIAAAVLDIHPHATGWQPSYWFMQHRGYTPDAGEISKQYYLASFGGLVSSRGAKALYDRLMINICYRSGVQYVFPLYSKFDYQPSRAKT